MARAWVTYKLNETECLSAGVKVKATYPDALDDLTARVRTLLREALVDIVAVTRADESASETEAG